MKKLLIPAICLIPMLSVCTACNKKTDYFEFVSELRSEIYCYQDDQVSLKIYCAEKETPYALDGVKGAMTDLCEVYFESATPANEVEIKLLGHGGEMNYLAVTRNFYLSFGAERANLTSVPVEITVDGKQYNYEVPSVGREGVIDPKVALKCVTEYDKESFDALKNGNSFSGEISVRLLYDGGCFYYVGLCDRQGNVHAYLLDAGDGRVIAERESQAEHK